jgi:hypothetical protein
MSHRRRLTVVCIALLIFVLVPHASPARAAGSTYTVTGWNNLGMHCMDADFSVFSILPPYNVIYAQVMDPSGALVTNPAGITVTYEGVADPTGSINTTSVGKTNFWQFVLPLFGASPAPDMGLGVHGMPGAANTPQAMTWDGTHTWFVAEGIPITPFDNALHHRPYPLMRLVARDGSGAVLATTDIVLPVSDEMDCRACHASGSADAARPAAGWVNNPDPQIDYRQNVLLVHDDRQAGLAAFQQALVTAGYSASGLYATAQAGTPILCAKCHASNALPGTGLPGIPQLTHSVHGSHATVVDPTTQMTLGNSQNRSACYRCHPGATTRCLRGAMGKAVATDGTMAMQCQSCHGSMSEVGANSRQGWFDQPACQNCHTGTALKNNGQIRYTSAIDAGGARRVAVDTTFATNPNAPAAGFSLYRFSFGHGGLACEACHGPTHAEAASFEANDNIQNTALQGHAGVLVDCTACHASDPATISGGPHGMHPVGQGWVSRHPDVAENNKAACQTCHGTDYRGTVLSFSQGNRSLSAFGKNRNFWQGFQVGCYACHSGPSSDSATPNHAPVASNGNLSAWSGGSSSLVLAATDADRNALSYRVVSQPGHGTVGLSGATATYFSEPGYVGADSFTWAAWDGSVNSNLATVTVAVGTNTCALLCDATVPSGGVEGSAVSFLGSATPAGCSQAPQYSWTFGDGQTGIGASAPHTFALSGNYGWGLTVRADGTTCTRAGSIAVAGIPPNVTTVKKLSAPFRLTITGTNFHGGIQVFIGGTGGTGGVLWTQTVRKSGTSLLLKGGNPLKALFPASTWVQLRLVNPDDALMKVVEYNRTLGQFRAVP